MKIRWDFAASIFGRKLRLVLLISLLVATAILTFIQIYRVRQVSTPLVDAAGSGDLASAKRLLEKGADINQHAKGMFGATPLIMAIYTANTNAAVFLLNNGADVNARDYEGQGKRI